MSEKFSFSTIEDFDKHIDTSILNYDSMNYMIENISDFFIEEESCVVDIGCSTGKFIKNLKDRHTDKNNIDYIGLEINKNFTKDLKTEDNLCFLETPVELYSFNNCNLVTSVFTLQFIKLNKRQGIVNNIYAGLNKGGAFVLSEKVLSNDSKINDVFNFSYYDFKKESFNSDEILNKETDLRPIMKTITLKENISMLKNAGFSKIDILFKTYNFVSIIAIK